MRRRTTPSSRWRSSWRVALDANPNIIETLYTDSQHVLYINRYGERLVAARRLFLSRRVAERFSGYAIDQLQRMERHHRWLVDPPASPPRPEEFGARDVGGRYRWPHSDAERAYRPPLLKHGANYQAWPRNRNPARGQLEGVLRLRHQARNASVATVAHGRGNPPGGRRKRAAARCGLAADGPQRRVKTTIRC